MRRHAPPPAPCGCAERIAALEALTAALAAAVVTLRPRLAGHSIERGLAGWGVAEPDAAVIAAAVQARSA